MLAAASASSAKKTEQAHERQARRAREAPERAEKMLDAIALASELSIEAMDVTAAELSKLDPETREKMVKTMRQVLMLSQDVSDQTEVALRPLMGEKARSSRAGHLSALSEKIGQRPTRTWEEEWEALTNETLDMSPWLKGNAAVELDIKAKTERLEGQIVDLEKEGWPRERAVVFLLLATRKAALARAMRDGDRTYAASIYKLGDTIFEQHDVGCVEEMMYSHVEGLAGLAFNEPKWSDLTVPDHTGFRGITAASLVAADSDPERFTDEGHCAYDFKAGKLVAQDSDVVGFMPQPASQDGAHSAVGQGQGYCVYPPNTLFRLREIKEPGTWEAPGGTRPKQRLLVVTGTYKSSAPIEKDVTNAGKMCVQLSYGTRTTFVSGLEDVMQLQTLSLEDEWNRDYSWSDWRGASYTYRGEWSYVIGNAVRKEGCTPGTRDDANHGKSVEQFVSEVNDFVKGRVCTRHHRPCDVALASCGGPSL